MEKLLLLLTATVLLYGCRKEPAEVKGEPVSLIINDDGALFTKSVTLFNNNDYLIKTPFDSFVLGFPFSDRGGIYEYYRKKAIDSVKLHNVLVSVDYLPYPLDTLYTLAGHLEKGSCHIRDKLTGTTITSVNVENYSEGGPMTTTGGRRFYLKGKLFFSTVDFMSKK